MPLSSEVSVVIPVHNGAAFVAAAVESVLAQKGSCATVARVIVVDNNSTDGTGELVGKLIASRWGERVIAMSETRPYAANARNAGCRVARGEWLAFLDADDLWLPCKLERQMEAAALHSEASLFFTVGEEFYSEELGPDKRSCLACRPQPYPMLTPTSLLLRREVFKKVGDLPDVSSGEFIAWFGWARELGFREFVVPEVLTRRRIHANNTTREVGAMAGYPLAAKWLLDRRRQARTEAQALLEAGL